MPQRSEKLLEPREYLVEGEWPDGAFAVDAPDSVAYTVHVAKALSAALAGLNKKKVADDARINRNTIYDLLGGKTWPDMVTLAVIEKALGITLWPSEPPTLRRKS